MAVAISLFATSVHAEKKISRTEIIKRGHESILNGIERSSVRLPSVDIIYDTDTRVIEIVCSVKCDAIVYLTDSYGNLIGTFDSIDMPLYLPESFDSVFHIRIESDNWYATADIKI